MGNYEVLLQNKKGKLTALGPKPRVSELPRKPRVGPEGMQSIRSNRSVSFELSPRWEAHTLQGSVLGQRETNWVAVGEEMALFSFLNGILNTSSYQFLTQLDRHAASPFKEAYSTNFVNLSL